MKMEQRIALGMSATLSILAACGSSVSSGVDGAGGNGDGAPSTGIVGVGVAVAVASSSGSGGDTSSGGTGGADQGTGGASPETPPTTHAYSHAIPFGKLTTTSGQPPTIQASDPSSMVLFLSKEDEDCSAGQLTPQSGATVWQAAIVIPTSELKPGRIDTSKVGIYTYLFFPDRSGGGGGGPMSSGVIWVDSASDTQIALTIGTPITISGSEQGSATTSVSLAGTYVFQVCPGG